MSLNFFRLYLTNISIQYNKIGCRANAFNEYSFINKITYTEECVMKPRWCI